MDQKIVIAMAATGVAAACAAILAWPGETPAVTPTAPTNPDEVVSPEPIPSAADRPSDWDVSERRRIETLIAGHVRASVSMEYGTTSHGQIGSEYCGSFKTEGRKGLRAFHVAIGPSGDDETAVVSVSNGPPCDPISSWVVDGKTLSPVEAKRLDDARAAAVPHGEPWYAPGYSPADEARREAEGQALLDRRVKEMLAMEEIQRRSARGEPVRSSDIDWR